MSDTIFVNAVTLTDADWFNDVNRLHYTIFGDPATAAVAARALQNKGADIASAATLDLSSATGDFVHITGTTNITAITLASGKEMTLVFDGILTLTYNATTLILPTSANITTAAGDTAVFRGDGSGNVRCISYVRRTGAPLGVTYAAGGVVYSTASALAVSSVGTSGAVLRSGGTGAPTWSSATYPTNGTSGKVLRGDGTNIVASTATYPDTVTADRILHGTSTNVIGENSDLVYQTSNNIFQVGSGTASENFYISVGGAGDTSSAISGNAGTIYHTNNGGGGYTKYVVGIDYSISQAFVVARTSMGVGTSSFKIDTSGIPYFPEHDTTASAANAYLDSSTGKLQRSTSSLRYKKDVEPVDAHRIDAVMQLEPIWYRSKCPGDRQDWSWYGLGAEDVAAVEPRLVHWTKQRDEKGEIIPDAPLIPDGVMYERVSVLLLGVVKNQQKEIQSLKDEVAAIKATLGM